MARIKRRHIGKRGELTHTHRHQLMHGSMGLSDSGWGNPPYSEEVLEEMRDAWEELRDELLKRFITDWPCKRPWAWWQFDAPDDPDASIPEQENLERWGVLGADELIDASTSAGPPPNYFHNAPFRRSWNWWRFTAPERRDYSRSEAEQLVTVGAAVLNPREAYIVANKADDPWCRKMFSHGNPDPIEHLFFTDDELTYLRNQEK